MGDIKKFKKTILIFILILFTFVSSGCWNYREIDTMAIVAGIAIDKDTATNNFILTVEIVNINSQGQSVSVGSETFSLKSRTIFDGIRNIVAITGLRLFWAHTKVLIISEEIAKEGMIPVIDWFTRDSEPRIDMWILISKEKTASEILKNKVNITNVVSFHIDDMMKSGGILNKYPESDIEKFTSEMSEEGKSSSVATITNEKIDDRIAPKIDGSAVFKQDKLVGYLNGNETMVMLMIKNKLQGGLIALKNVDNSNTDVTLEIFQNKTKLKPVFKNGKITMMIDLYPTVAIDELSGSDDFIDVNKRGILQKDAEDKVSQNIQELINKLQIDYDCDVLGFGEYLAENNPKELRELKKNNRDVFANIKTEVKVHMIIKGSGEMSKSNNIK